LERDFWARSRRTKDDAFCQQFGNVSFESRSRKLRNEAEAYRKVRRTTSDDADAEIGQKWRFQREGGVKVSTGIVSKGCMPGMWVGPVKNPTRLSNADNYNYAVAA
jgi:hypothetical protein